MSNKFLSTLKKAGSTAGDVLTTKGDILSRSASALARLAVGTNGQVLTCASGETTGLQWANASGGITLSREVDSLGSSFSTASTSKVAVTGLSIVLESSGDCILAFNSSEENNGVNQAFFDIYDGSDPLVGASDLSSIANHVNTISLNHSMEMDSETLTIRLKAGGGTELFRINGAAEVFQSTTFEVNKFT
jgi:hypothetical protein|tara:strand:+ start:108 stop:680 length:573 start_codon:yes stop_codon:yes gene_type:complete